MVNRERLDIHELGDRYAALVRLIDGGKRVGDAVYMHQSLLAEQPRVVRGLIAEAVDMAALPSEAFNVVRVTLRRPEVALLDYPEFFEDPFPVLRRSWLVGLDTARVSTSDFSMQENPPILHRKELILPAAHPERERFERLTASLEDYQAFDHSPHLIGRRLYWNDSLVALGLQVSDHQLIKLGGVSQDDRRPSIAVARHRTAISRSRLSTPMQFLARWGFLDRSQSVLDYGCGRGDDISALIAAGIDATGWDPHFALEAPLAEADVVNLGFVLNVIEAPKERADALTTAYRLAKRVLSVAVMLNGNGSGASHADGVLTKRQTFQRYYTQAELREYVAETLGREPVTVGPGIVFVFRADEDEQAFLARRQRSAPLPVDGFEMPAAMRGAAVRPSLYTRHQDMLDAFWAATLELGRLPGPDEINQPAEFLAAVGSPRRAFAALPFVDKDADLARVAARRKEDLLVYLALNIFERRLSFQAMPLTVQWDVKAFFGSYKVALDRARASLFEAGDPERTIEASTAAASRGIGVLDDTDGDYMFHASLLTDQPATLRIILGCAERIEPQPPDLDLIKIHGSGQKVSYLRFDNFAQRALPTLARRIVVDLRRQRVAEVQTQTPDGPRVLLGKAQFMPPDAVGKERQEKFDEELRRKGMMEKVGLGPGYRVLARRFAQAGGIPGKSRAPEPTPQNAELPG